MIVARGRRGKTSRGETVLSLAGGRLTAYCGSLSADLTQVFNTGKRSVSNQGLALSQLLLRQDGWGRTNVEGAKTCQRRMVSVKGSLI